MRTDHGTTGEDNYDGRTAHWDPHCWSSNWRRLENLLRQMIAMFADAMMSAQADQVCGAGYGKPCAEGTNRRIGYRPGAVSRDNLTSLWADS